jgi:uncharacterized protein YegJ (DUF2314 family)
MRNILLIIFFWMGILACRHPQVTKQVIDPKTHIYHTRDSDFEMEIAIAAAKSTLRQFDTALASNTYNSSTFSLKVEFPTKGGGEHIWVSSITVEDGDYFGIVANDPVYTKQIKYGDAIKIDKKKISDWMYSDNGILRGGFTVKLIRSRMTPEERKEFDTEFPYKIEK